MSLADCLKGLKLDKNVIKEINKDIKSFIKKGMSQIDAEQMAIENQIDKTKAELDSIREKLPGDLAPVQFNIDKNLVGDMKLIGKNGKEFFQNAPNSNFTVIKFSSSSIDTSKFLQGKTNYLKDSAELTEYFKKLGLKARSSKSLNTNAETFKKTVSYLTRLKSASWAIEKMGFNSQKEAIVANSIVINNLDEIYKTAVSFEKNPSMDRKERDIGGWVYKYAIISIDGKANLVKFRSKNVLTRNTNGTSEKETFYFENVLGEVGTQEAIQASKNANIVGATSAATPNSIPDSIIAKFESIVNAAQSSYPFWQSNQSLPQGSFQVRSDGQKIISIFNSQNQSTFIHEIGHYYLESLFNTVMAGDGTTKEMNKWKAIADYLEYNPDLQNKLTVDQHEKFARSFEAYLMEGKAPSKDLLGAFRSFRKWLIGIYKTVSNLDVQLTPEIRDLFASMLTTDRIQKETELESGMYISDIESEIGSELTDKVKNKILDLKEQASDMAFEKIFKTQYKLLGEQHKKFIAEMRKNLTKKYFKEISSSDVGVEYNTHIDITGYKDLKGYANKILSGKLNEDQKLKAELNAELLGYTSADHMAKSMLDLKSIDEMVKEKVDSDIASVESQKEPGAIKAEAMRKIRNDHSLELLALEKELLLDMALKENESELNKIADAMAKDNQKLLQDWLIAKEVNKVTKKFNEKLSAQKERFSKEIKRLQERAEKQNEVQRQKELVRRWLEAKDATERTQAEREFRDSIKRLKSELGSYSRTETDRIKALAREVLLKKNINEASRFTSYFANERNAALKLAKAIQDNDWSKALQYKNEQLLNHALARESVRISNKAKSSAKYLNDMRKLKKELWKHEDHYNQAAKVLARFGFVRSDFNPDAESITLREWADKYDNGLGIISISEWLFDESIKIDPSNLKVEQLQEIVEAVKNIRQVANTSNKAFKAAKQMELSLIKDKMLQSSKENVPASKRIKENIYETGNGIVKDAKYLADKYVSKYFMSQQSIETLIAKLDGFKDSGIWRDVLVKTVYSSANDESNMNKELQEKLVNLYGIYTKEELKKFKIDKIFIPELNASITKETLISMALNLGNESNKEKLFETAGVGFDQTYWNESTVMAALQNNLKEKDWKFVQDTWDLIDSYWPKIKELHTKVTGFAPEKVKAVGFSVISEGKAIDLKGGYYPLKQDARASREANAREIADTPLYTENNPSFIAATKKGHTKSRTKAKYPIKLSLGVIDEHLSNVIHDLTFRESVIDLRRIMSSGEMQNDVKQTLGSDGYDLIMQYISSVAAQDPDRIPPGDIITGVLKTMRKNTTAYMLALNVRNIIQNFSNVWLYSGAVDGFTQADTFKAIAKSIPARISSFSNADNNLDDFVFSRSPFMRDRTSSPEFALKEVTTKAFGEDKKMSEFAQMLMAYTDNMTAIPVWIEAYTKKINEGSKEKDAIEYADTLIKRSIGSGRRYDQASILRSGELVKLFTMFSSFMNVQYNRWSRENGIALKEKDVAKYTAFVGAQLLFVLSSAFLTFKWTKDDEDKEEKWLATQMLDYGLGMTVAGRYASPLIIDRMINGRPATLRVSPAFEIMNQVYTVGNKTFSESATKQDKIEAVAKAALMTTGTPNQFGAWFFNGVDIANGMKPELSDTVKRRPKKER